VLTLWEGDLDRSKRCRDSRDVTLDSLDYPEDDFSVTRNGHFAFGTFKQKLDITTLSGLDERRIACLHKRNEMCRYVADTLCGSSPLRRNNLLDEISGFKCE
jgi:hypothetical protein